MNSFMGMNMNMNPNMNPNMNVNTHMGMDASMGMGMGMMGAPSPMQQAPSMPVENRSPAAVAMACAALAESAKNRPKLPFPFVLYDLLETLENHSLQMIVSWMPNGLAFQVHDVNMFVNVVMKHYFTSNKFKSFTRQLYLYGFKRLENGSFHNMHFRRGQRASCYQMRRIASSSSSSGGKSGTSKRKAKAKRVLPPDLKAAIDASAAAECSPATSATATAPASPSSSSANHAFTNNGSIMPFGADAQPFGSASIASAGPTSALHLGSCNMSTGSGSGSGNSLGTSNNSRRSSNGSASLVVNGHNQGNSRWSSTGASPFGESATMSVASASPPTSPRRSHGGISPLQFGPGDASPFRQMASQDNRVPRAQQQQQQQPSLYQERDQGEGSAYPFMPTQQQGFFDNRNNSSQQQPNNNNMLTAHNAMMASAQGFPMNPEQQQQQQQQPNDILGGFGFYDGPMDFGDLEAQFQAFNPKPMSPAFDTKPLTAQVATPAPFKVQASPNSNRQMHGHSNSSPFLVEPEPISKDSFAQYPDKNGSNPRSPMFKNEQSAPLRRIPSDASINSGIFN